MTLLRVAAGWTVFVWAVFVRNILRDHTRSTGFKVVHVVLAMVSIAFAIAIWAVASAASRRRTQKPPKAAPTAGGTRAPAS